MVLAAGVATAQQTVSLDSTANREVWQGDTTGSQFGMYLDRGDLNGDARNDLIVGAPGWSSSTGRVYAVFGGPVRGGTVPVSNADVTFTGAAAGDKFGTSTAAGWITTRELDVPQLSRDLVVGAPNAAVGGSNAGAVYLFRRSNFVKGQAFTPADAILTINGAAGIISARRWPRANLDGYGYREIIIGAPGSNRVYVIKGGAAVGGTINLGVAVGAGADYRSRRRRHRVGARGR